MLVITDEGETRYVSRYHEDNDEFHRENHLHDEGLDPMVKIALLGVLILALFILVLLMILRTIARPVESLQDWAKNINIDDLKDPIPNFKYKELNDLAGIIHNSLGKVSKTLEREQEFLRYASHELRTPIAIIRSNSSILLK